MSLWFESYHCAEDGLEEFYCSWMSWIAITVHSRLGGLKSRHSFLISLSWKFQNERHWQMWGLPRTLFDFQTVVSPWITCNLLMKTLFALMSLMFPEGVCKHQSFRTLSFAYEFEETTFTPVAALTLNPDCQNFQVTCNFRPRLP